jgi:hypothetical protein
MQAINEMKSFHENFTNCSTRDSLSNALCHAGVGAAAVVGGEAPRGRKQPSKMNSHGAPAAICTNPTWEIAVEPWEGHMEW